MITARPSASPSGTGESKTSFIKPRARRPDVVPAVVWTRRERQRFFPRHRFSAERFGESNAGWLPRSNRHDQIVERSPTNRPPPAVATGSSPPVSPRQSYTIIDQQHPHHGGRRTTLALRGLRCFATRSRHDAFVTSKRSLEPQCTPRAGSYSGALKTCTESGPTVHRLDALPPLFNGCPVSLGRSDHRRRIGPRASGRTDPRRSCRHLDRTATPIFAAKKDHFAYVKTPRSSCGDLQMNCVHDRWNVVSLLVSRRC